MQNKVYVYKVECYESSTQTQRNLQNVSFTFFSSSVQICVVFTWFPNLI